MTIEIQCDQTLTSEQLAKRACETVLHENFDVDVMQDGKFCDKKKTLGQLGITDDSEVRVIIRAKEGESVKRWCACCGLCSSRKKFKKCGKCLAVFYCSKECQLAHWYEDAGHKVN